MIYDKTGKLLEPKPEPHKFGHFNVPPDARLVMGNTLTADNPYPWTGTYGVGNKDHAKIRDERR